MKLYFNIFILLCCTTTVLKAQLKATATGIFEVSCSNPKSGKIEIKVTGAAAPVTFLWQDKNTDAIRENLSAGIYTVTISDAINQKLIGSYEIKSPTPMIFNAGFHWNCAIWGPPVDEDYLSTDEGALRNATYPINITEYDKKAGTIYQGPYTVLDSLFSIGFNKQKYCKIVDSRQCTLVYDPILPKWDVSNFTVDITPKFTINPSSSSYIVKDYYTYLNVGEEIKLSGLHSISTDSVKYFG